MKRIFYGSLIVLSAALMLLELGVRLFGVVFAPSHAGAKSHIASSKHTVLCIGDSFVSGLGGIGFPEQMQDILNSRHPPGTFQVINRGKAGSNSSYVIVELPEALKVDRPDLVILLTGITNMANPVRLDTAPTHKTWLLDNCRVIRMLRLAKTGQYSLGLKNFWAKRELLKLEKAMQAMSAPHKGRQESRNDALAGLHIQKARLYCGMKETALGAEEIDKAAALAPIGSPADTATGIFNAYRECGLPDKALRFAETAQLHKSAATDLMLATAALYKKHGNFSKARELILRAMHRNQRDWTCHYELGLLAQAENMEAKEHFRRAIRLFPKASSPHYALGVEWLRSSRRDATAEFKLALRYDPSDINALSRLADIYSGLGTPEKFSSLEWEVPELKKSPQYRNIKSYIKSPRDISEPVDNADALKNELQTDISRAICAVRKTGAVVIVSSYPEEDLPGLREAARENNTEYVDFTTIFKDKFRRRDEYLAYDRFHCNSKGYRIMAETFAARAEAILLFSTHTAASPEKTGEASSLR